MRYSADWMVLADDRILEYLRVNESGSPKRMADSGVVRYSREYINQRCKKLSKEGFLRDYGNGVYVIADQGEKYLDGDLDAQTLEKINGVGGQNGAQS